MQRSGASAAASLGAHLISPASRHGSPAASQDSLSSVGSYEVVQSPQASPAAPSSSAVLTHLQAMEMSNSGSMAGSGQDSAGADEPLAGIGPFVQVRLDERYLTTSYIGSGSQSLVFEAEDLVKEEKVAVKKLVNAFDDLNTAKHALREIMIMQYFDHPNLLGVRDLVLPDQQAENMVDVHIVMERMAYDLRHVLSVEKVLDVPQAQLYIYQILRGLKCLHSAGVIHRDLKPANCLLKKNHDLKICDFGMGKGAFKGSVTKVGGGKSTVSLGISSGSGTSSAGSAGGTLQNTLLAEVTTLAYRAPEGLFSATRYSSAVDVWSVGCMLAEMFKGSPLFCGNDVGEQCGILRNFFGSDALLEAIEILVPENDPEFKNSLKRDLSFKHVPKPEYCPFSTMFGDDVCLDAIDLMRRMVRLLPKDRISVADALRHPFLSNLHNPRDEPVAPRMDFKWGCDATTIEDIKAVVFQEIVRFKHNLAMAELRMQKPAEAPTRMTILDSGNAYSKKRHDEIKPVRSPSLQLSSLTKVKRGSPTILERPPPSEPRVPSSSALRDSTPPSKIGLSPPYSEPRSPSPDSASGESPAITRGAIDSGQVDFSPSRPLLSNRKARIGGGSLKFGGKSSRFQRLGKSTPSMLKRQGHSSEEMGDTVERAKSESEATDPHTGAQSDGKQQ